MSEYWDILLQAYHSIPDNGIFSIKERWWVAYTIAEYKLGLGQDIVFPPVFEPKAQTGAEFAAQYADAIKYMMCMRAPDTELPHDFIRRWREVEDKEKSR